MRRLGKQNKTIDIDEIFIDRHNNPGYHRENLEGVLERPIAERVFVIIGGVFVVLAGLFLFRISFLQIGEGAALRERSINNHLRLVVQEPERGPIYDRFGNILASNELRTKASIMDAENATSTRLENFQLLRRYPESGFLHVLGFLRKDAGITKGVTGLEAQYDENLRGTPRKKIEEINAAGFVIGSGLATVGTPGYGLVTTISRDLQLRLSEFIQQTKEERGFHGGVGMVINVKNGEVLALVSIPEFNPNILGRSITQQEFQKYLNDPERPFFNRSILGLYPPGSIIKPVVAAGALVENIIDPFTEIVSTGKLILPNPYDATKPSIFLDWKAHGAVDMRRALAVSSDVYFYEIGGGFEKQKGLGVVLIKKYLSLFGFDALTGIDLPGEKIGLLPNETKNKNGFLWTVGHTYHLAIGQGDLLVTPVAMGVYATTLASRGTIVQPHLTKAVVDEHKNIVETFSYSPKKTNIVPDNVFDVIHEGMRQAVLSGTASGLGGLPIAVAAKTGTAEIGKTGRVHSWSIGFFPYEDPQLAYMILMEDGSVNNLVGATYVASQMIQWIADTNFLEDLNKGFE